MNVIITKEEIYNTPNDAELGRLVRNKFWQEERNQRGPQFDDEHFGLVIGEDGLVTKIVHDIGGSYEIKEAVQLEMFPTPVKAGIYEECILCGIETTTLKTTHIDFRTGYIEGAGQLCNECYEKRR